MKHLAFLLLSLTTGQLWADEAAAVATKPSLIESLVPFVLIFAMMYFLLIRPQLKKAKEQATLLKDLKPGDEVFTSGGIIGKIRTVADRYVIIDAGNTTLKIMKDHVTGLTTPSPKA